MKRLYIWAFALFFSLPIWAQGSLETKYVSLSPVETPAFRVSPKLFNQLMAAQPGISETTVQKQYQQLDNIVHNLRRKLEKSRSTEQFLKYLFYDVHRSYLKRYRPHATLNDLLTTGAYDCVSGTALYALLLDAFEINFSVQEMTYHMYLKVPLGDGVVLIESTDPLAGLVLDDKAVAERKAQYLAEEVDQKIYAQPIRAEVGMAELVGLSYFNAAVFHYNQQKFTTARQQLRQAIRWYPANRMYAFQAIIEAVAVR